MRKKKNHHNERNSKKNHKKINITEEEQVFKFINKNYHNKIERNTKHLIEGKEIDIYLPLAQFAIEFDGLYWHSTEFHDSDYHKKKTDICKKKNITLLHVFEQDWRNKKPIVCDIIKKSIKHENIKRIYARECYIEKVTNERDRNRFLKENCIDGTTNKGTCYAIVRDNKNFSNGKQYLAMFVLLKVNKQRMDLIRYAEANGFKVIGGISKFLNYFKAFNPTRKLYIKIDLRYFDGKEWIKSGCNVVSNIEPKYCFFLANDSSHIVTYPSTFLTKEKIKKMYPEIDINRDFDEILKDTEYRRIYDCGYTILRY